MKKFNYYGQEITVPDYAKYVATDKDGEVWWYTNKPVMLSWLGLIIAVEIVVDLVISQTLKTGEEA